MQFGDAVLVGSCVGRVGEKEEVGICLLECGSVSPGDNWSHNKC